MTTISFARRQSAIIRHAAWLNVRFTLSFSGVEDLLAELGLDVCYETVRREVRAVVRWRASPQAPFADPPMAPRRDWRANNLAVAGGRR
jgi:transposase-like protein